MSKWHGWSKGALSLHIGVLPGRKRPALYAATSNKYVASIYPLATFGSDEAATEAMRILDEMFGMAAGVPTQGEGE